MGVGTASRGPWANSPLPLRVLGSSNSWVLSVAWASIASRISESRDNDEEDCNETSAGDLEGRVIVAASLGVDEEVENSFRSLATSKLRRECSTSRSPVCAGCLFRATSTAKMRSATERSVVSERKCACSITQRRSITAIT